MSDLTISLEKVLKKGNKLVRGNTKDALQLGGFSRRHFQVMLDKGTYTFKIRTGPTAKEMDGDTQVYTCLLYTSDAADE